MITAKDQLKKVKSLLLLERKEDLEFNRRILLQSPIKKRQEDGVTWYPLELYRSFIGSGERMVMEFIRATYKGKPHLFQPGKAISLFVNSGDSKPNSAKGVVNFVKDDLISITLNHDDIPEWINDGKPGINLVFDEASYKVMDKALDSVIDAKKGRLAEIRDYLLCGGARTNDSNAEIKNNFLNTGQSDALKMVLNARDVAFIHGPPGTGKTTTLVETIRNVLQFETQVLVCAPSNAAVDLLTEKISDIGIKVVRIGHPARVTVESQNKTLDVRISEHNTFPELQNLRKRIEEFNRTARKYKRKYGREEMNQRRLLLQEVRTMKADADNLEEYIINNIIEKTRVITSTLVGSFSPFLMDKRFPVVFIDEASQALEPASWIPILKAEKVIFAGDHWQLPPTIKSREAAKEGLSETLFEKGIKNNNMDIMLSVQYRMNNIIMGFSNEMFYNNKLVADNHVKEWLVSNNDNPLTFIDTAGFGSSEEKDPETQSLFNRGEAEILIEFLGKYLSDFEPWLRNSEIGIISPYRAQVDFINRLLTNNKFPATPKITINTVDSFQGQEREVIFISMVRSNNKNEIGFLEDTRRMNVALTRAKKKLVIIGDSATIGKNSFYSRFLDYIFKFGKYLSAFEIRE